MEWMTFKSQVPIVLCRNACFTGYRRSILNIIGLFHALGFGLNLS